jgi:copper/silver efflux system protein
MTVCVILASLVPILRETGVGSDAEPLVGGMIISTIHVWILVPAYFALMKEWDFRGKALTVSEITTNKSSETE